jgi:amino-acid N-acetyltransferase
VTRSAAVRAALPVLGPTAAPAVERRRWILRDDLLVLYPGPDRIVIRSAGPGDAREIHALLEGFAAAGRLLARTLDQVCSTIRDYVVAVEGDRIIGCGALRIYSETLAEIGALAVAADRQGEGIGGRIVRALLDEARALGLRRIFALTLEERFFHRQGFRTTDVRQFPAKIARDCAGCAKRTHCPEIAVECDLGDEAMTA